jgi:hypothetical protein
VYLLCLSLCYIMQGRQLFGESMFLQSLSCFVGMRKSSYHVHVCYRWVASCLDDWLWPYEPPLAPRDALLGSWLCSTLCLISASIASMSQKRIIELAYFQLPSLSASALTEASHIRYTLFWGLHDPCVSSEARIPERLAPLIATTARQT